MISDIVPTPDDSTPIYEQLVVDTWKREYSEVLGLAATL